MRQLHTNDPHSVRIRQIRAGIRRLSPNSFTLSMALLGVIFTGSACASRTPRAAGARAQNSESVDGAAWYEFDWLRESPYAPSFRVLDTESSLGPYAEHAKTLTLGDLVRMHGHACDGLVMAACALSVGLDDLYPEGVIDRTDTGCISNNSPCFGDVAAYVTGGRIRFGTQKIDPTMGKRFIVVRFSTGEAVEVVIREGVFPEDLEVLEGEIRRGGYTVEQMRACQTAQWDYAKGLLERPLEESFLARPIDLVWEPDEYAGLGMRGDIVHRDAPR